MSETQRSSPFTGSGSTTPNSSSDEFRLTPPSSQPSMVRAPSKRSSVDGSSLGNRGGGCWTCRIRRKKCDEIKEDNSCKTCKRLKIDCLGWSEKRPDWLKDNDQIKRYRESITRQITEAGLRRGVARPSSEARSKPPEFTSPTLPKYDPNGTTAANGSVARTGSRSNSASSVPTQAAPWPDNGLPLNVPHLPHGQPLSYMYTDRNAYYDNPYISPVTGHDPNSAYLNSAEDLAGLNLLDPISPVNSNYYPSPTYLNGPMIQPPPPMNPQDNLTLHYMNHYFGSVAGLEFPFAGSAPSNITYSIVCQEPRGAVAYAICALAALHLCRQRGQLDTEDNLTMAKRFYNDASLLISQNLGQYTDTDAVAAIHLIMFSISFGGRHEWTPMMAVLQSWIMQTEITSHDDPMRVLSGLSEISSFVVKATMWFDILASISMRTFPRFLGLYRRLLASEISMPQDAESMNIRVNFENFIGCPDEIVLCLAEVSNLAYWKSQEERQKQLSYRTLVHQGDAIERRLRRHTPLAIRYGTPPSTQMHFPNSMNPPPRGIAPSDDIRQIVADIFRETVALHLHALINGSNPGVPEIRTGVTNLMNQLSKLSPTSFDRTLLFPICLGGCLANESQRDFFKSRMGAQDDFVGNALQARSLMEAVWQQRDRDPNATAVDWRILIQEQCPYLLLV